jgi:hypothetical protein
VFEEAGGGDCSRNDSVLDRKIEQRLTILSARMKKRCEFPECKKAISILSHPCKCKKDLCPAHMNAHGCTFDYRAEQTEKLMKLMSTPVVGQKIIPV